MRTQEETEPLDSEDGYRILPEGQFEVDVETEYQICIEEHSSAVNESDLEYKSLVFVPDKNAIEFSDRAGSTVYLPIERLPEVFDSTQLSSMISEINEKRKRLINWDTLDSQGSDFQEIIYRLIERDDEYSNVHWGGEGQDQGKDAFCSITQGGRETNILVQMKFNNEGSSVNDKQVERYIRKASRHDCRGLIVAAIKTSGDLETDFYDGNLISRDLSFFRLWSGPEIKEMLSEHPNLIAEYFLQ